MKKGGSRGGHSPHLDTKVVHAGVDPEKVTGAIMTPIFQTSTYVQQGINEHQGFEYGRTHNPTRASLEKSLAALEGGAEAIAFSSGLAAIQAMMTFFRGGDHVVVHRNLYGGTYRLFETILRPWGLDFSYVDLTNHENLILAIRPTTRLIFLETPTNPLLALVDIEAIVKLARKKTQALVAVDNTFMSPYFQNPLSLGADLVVHSCTKYLNGHSDVIGGVVIGNHLEALKRIKFTQNAGGAVPGPMDCFLTLRGIKTLAVRMRQHEANAREIADVLAHRRDLDRVIYPGLKNHPQHALAKRQARGFGAMISLDVGSLARARKVVKKVKLFSYAESLGGVESLMCHPATMTHASVPRESRLAMGLTDGLLRLSVGIEGAQDLIGDLEAALG